MRFVDMLHSEHMLTCMRLYADMYFFIEMHVPNYKMHQTKKHMSTYRSMLVNKGEYRF